MNSAAEQLPTGVALQLAAGHQARARGLLDTAKGHYQSVVNVVPWHPVALKALADIEPQSNSDLVRQIELAFDSVHTPTEQAILHFAAGKCYDDLGKIDAAWTHWTFGNRLDRDAFCYDVDTDVTTMRSLEESFPAIEPAQTWLSDSCAPVFIVGLPRCGSTLLELALAQHPQIASLGESPAMPDAITMLAAPDMVDQPMRWQVALTGRALREEYLWRSGARMSKTPRWVDKQLLNFCYIPMILHAFPRARIIEIRRHPLGQALALYRVRFPQGGWQFTYALDEIALFMGGYYRMMRHWHALERHRLLTISHEHLVTDFVGTVSAVLDFLDLSPAIGCYTPQKSRLAVRTMSAVQVRQPVDSGRAAAWERYAAYLEPVRAQLAASCVL